MKEPSIKICIAASVGGHLSEVLLLRNSFMKHDYFLVTELTDLTKNMIDTEKVYFLKHINRLKLNFPYKFFVNTIKSLQIIVKEKPKLIITTGVLCTIPLCFFGKLFGAKLVFIECYSRIHSATLTGRLVYPLTDLFIVQHEGLLKFYPKAIVSSIF